LRIGVWNDGSGDIGVDGKDADLAVEGFEGRASRVAVTNAFSGVFVNDPITEDLDDGDRCAVFFIGRHGIGEAFDQAVSKKQGGFADPLGIERAAVVRDDFGEGWIDGGFQDHRPDIVTIGGLRTPRRMVGEKACIRVLRMPDELGWIIGVWRVDAELDGSTGVAVILGGVDAMGGG